MNLKQTRLNILHKSKDLGKEAKTGVSLHCHTEHSKEMLDFLPYYAAKIPIVSYFWEKESQRYFGREGKEPNFSTGYWSPPFTGHEVYRMEKEQINRMSLEAVVSIWERLNISLDNPNWVKFSCHIWQLFPAILTSRLLLRLHR